jgi:hypothetical protein
MVLTVSFVLSPVTGLFVTVAGVMRSIITNLTPAPGRQDHTTSPSASHAVRQKRACVHRIPPHVRDDRETPLVWGGTARNQPVIWVACEADYFLSDNWTGQISLICHDKSGFPRIGLRSSFDGLRCWLIEQCEQSWSFILDGRCARRRFGGRSGQL